MKAAALFVGLFVLTATAHAQSGHATMHGWVCFDGIAYVDKQPTATVEFRSPDHPDGIVVSTKTDEHGIWNFSSAPLGEYILRISAPGYATWEAPVYISSDFTGNLAILLKKPKPAESQTR